MLRFAVARVLRACGTAARGPASAAGGSAGGAGRVLARATPAAVALAAWSQARRSACEEEEEAARGAAVVPTQAGDLAASSHRLITGKDKAPERVPLVPIFQTRVWRVVGDGDAAKAGDWIFHDMGLDKGGNLCYACKMADAMQVFHTREDLAKAMVEALPEGATCKPFCFRVQIPGTQPAIFAAPSPAFRDLWIHELAELTRVTPPSLQ